MAMKTVEIGGKGSSLTSASVYIIANGLAQVIIDSSILDKFSSSKSPPVSKKSLNVSNSTNPSFLTTVEARASLVVLLNKLIITQHGIRATLPLLITDTLNGGPFALESVDFGSTLGFLDSLCKVNDKNIEDVGVTDAELTVLEHSCYALDGICALLDFSSSCLSTVADAVASLSCEASSADVSALVNSLDSGDGFSDKDIVAVASDFKVLLTGSKLVGKNGCSAVSEIPEVHGSFRESVKQVHSKTRLKLNSSVRIGKDGSLTNATGGKQLKKTISSLAESLVHLGESSLCRVELVATSQDADIRSEVLEKSGALKKGIQLSSKDNYLSSFHEINNLVATVRNILAWEGALAVLSLDSMESKEKAQEVPVVSSSVETKKGNPNAEKKSQKKKKVVLGKGTAVVKQLLMDRLKSEGGSAIVSLAVLNESVQDLCLFFEPKDAGLDTFLKKVKEMVESNDSRRLPKLPKGTRDFAKIEMAIRGKAFKIIEEVFKRHGATALDTPAFELRETLMGKYGEDSKLVYDLADQGGELCSLRYDLTVPFARYVAMNGITSFKRYQIAKVYRRDNPSKGRYREFYQCDFDIAGQYETMGPDFEVVKVLTELLDELNIGDYEIKLNHRKLLDGMLEICGVPPEKFRTICSSIDKLDKQPFEEIKKEMVGEKGLTAEVADKIGTLVKKRGHPLELLSELKQDNQFLENNGSSLALKDLEILFDALEKSKCIHRVVFDLSLARGLDYYTGVIFEAVFRGTTQVGSIAAGGRYDNLIGMFGTKQVPAVGASLGIERVFNIMEQELEKDGNQSIRATETEVLVSIFGEDLGQAAELASEMWGAKIKAEYLVNKRVSKHMDRALESRIPLMVIVGDQERSANQVRIKDMQANEEYLVDRDSVIQEVQRRLKLLSL
ncbi:hypothetical protein MKW94_026766 [Papaver nudicaule]|uniref:Histidine--tRNA ligase, cytoplasmic n=1 Tax=Papaver nudicaule TaxID=74823 RepID=A0AA41S4A3_PAPNU|nr:hypothetical protein [Papaver nudicaule]